jgi:transposase
LTSEQRQPILLVHPFRLRARVERRTKTDKLDARLPANLLRIDQIPLAYIPPEPYRQLRELARRRHGGGAEPGFKGRSPPGC